MGVVTKGLWSITWFASRRENKQHPLHGAVLPHSVGKSALSINSKPLQQK